MPCLNAVVLVDLVSFMFKLSKQKVFHHLKRVKYNYLWVINILNYTLTQRCSRPEQLSKNSGRVPRLDFRSLGVRFTSEAEFILSATASRPALKNT
jgi:hypothetical protein